MENPKPPAHLHTVQVVVATLAGIISIVGGIYSLKTSFSQGKEAYGVLTGSVRDEVIGRPLRLATVEVSDANGDVIGTLSTDDNGFYSLKDLREGSYQVKAEAPLHASAQRRVTLQKSRTVTTDFNLTPTDSTEPPAAIPARPPASTYSAADFPSAETPYRNSFPAGRRTYHSNDPDYVNEPQTDEGLTQAQPTSRDFLVQAGTLLVQQMLENKKKKQPAA